MIGSKRRIQMTAGSCGWVGGWGCQCGLGGAHSESLHVDSHLYDNRTGEQQR